MRAHKYSIHPSENSLTGGNLITNTVKSAAGQELERRVHFTTAIKGGDRFAPLYTRRFYDVQLADVMQAAAIDQTICLGVTHPAFSLVLGVFVSAPHRRFEVDRELNNLWVAQHEFAKFRITVIWTFLSAPAGPSAEGAHVYTEKPKPGDNPLAVRIDNETIIGLTDEECISHFYSTCDGLIHRLKMQRLSEMQAANASDFEVRLMCNSFQIFRVASRQTTEWQAFKELAIERARQG
jgi:hypothetical protein